MPRNSSIYDTMIKEPLRTTIIIGAGAPLNFTLPEGSICPSTDSITEAVMKPYRNVFDEHKPITIVREMYDHLMATLPPDFNPWSADEKPYVHFEMLFHVIEMYYAYYNSWSGKCHNPDIFPIFGSFTGASRIYDIRELDQVMKPFIIRIMKIVHGYDDYFCKEKDGAEKWYKEFFANAPWKWDVFNFNYDTTVEQSLVVFEDGFEPIEGTDYYQFKPQKLMDNATGEHTVNHLHGCILYNYERDSNRAVYDYQHSDLFKYSSFEQNMDMMIGRSQSMPTAQNREQYVSGPIITGLRKTEKLNCIPYDFYHANLVNSILHNHALIICGYSFGDLYVNQLIERMRLIHGDKRRIVVIDYWNPNKIKESGIEHFLEYSLTSHFIMFLLRMCEVDYYGKLPEALNYKSTKKPMYSKNGSLMLLVNGMKDASAHWKEIEKFIR